MFSSTEIGLAVCLQSIAAARNYRAVHVSQFFPSNFPSDEPIQRVSSGFAKHEIRSIWLRKRSVTAEVEGSSPFNVASFSRTSELKKP